MLCIQIEISPQSPKTIKTNKEKKKKNQIHINVMCTSFTEKELPVSDKEVAENERTAWTELSLKIL